MRISTRLYNVRVTVAVLIELSGVGGCLRTGEPHSREEMKHPGVTRRWGAS